MAADTRLVDGSLNWSNGVNSDKPATVESPGNPEGLKRSELAWLTNATVRGGGIWPRTGFQYLTRLSDGSSLYQGGTLYEPDGANPYLVVSLGGTIYRMDCSAGATPVNLTASFPLVGANPAAVVQAFFCQGEKYLVIQAGDYVTLPLFWSGTTLMRSRGIVGQPNPALPNANMLPAAGPMDYYKGRLWYAFGRTYSAGDIVKGVAGTLANQYRDAILYVTENPLALGGDGFVVPSNAGNIVALKHTAAIDRELGEGDFYVFTRKSIYSLTVPETRSNWIGAGVTLAGRGPDAEPAQKVVQLVNGACNERSIVSVNGDLFFQSYEPAIRSFMLAVRDFSQWSNTPISRNIRPLLELNDRALMYAASGTNFNNRMLQAIDPILTPQGVVHRGIAVLNFDTVSTISEKLPPIWEGHWEGLQVFQLFTGDFGGLPRCFALVRDPNDGGIDLWELTNYAQSDHNAGGEARIPWRVEYPALTCSLSGSSEFGLKQLETAKLWVDRISGVVDIDVYFRPDGDPCWAFWHRVEVCSKRADNDDYPTDDFCEDDRIPITLPKPPDYACQPGGNQRRVNRGYQFQVKLIIKGFCRVRGFYIYCLKLGEEAFEGLNC